MKSWLSLLIFFIFACLPVIAEQLPEHFSAFPPPAQGPNYCSPIALGVDGAKEFMYVADQTGGRLIKFDLKKRQVRSVWNLAQEIQGLVVSKDGKTIYAVCGRHNGYLLIVDAQNGSVKNKILLGHTPMSPVLSPTEKVLYVVNRFDNELVALDVETGELKGKVSLPREPVAMAIAPNGKQLIVANHLPRGSANMEYKAEALRLDVERYQKVVAILDSIDTESEDIPESLKSDEKNEQMREMFTKRIDEMKAQISQITNIVVSCEVSVIDTEKLQKSDISCVVNVKLPNGVINMRGVCVSPDGCYAYMTHQVARYQAPTSQVTRGWINTNGLTVLNLQTLEQATVLLDDLAIGAANPWGLTCSEDGSHLLVTHSGVLDMSVINRDKLHQKIENYSGDDILMDLMFMRDIRQRLQIPSRWTDANGARSLVVVDGSVFLGLYFDESIAELSWLDGNQAKTRVYELVPRHELTSERRGEIFFFDAEKCLEKWQSCISCHPDARADGLNWDLLNDGIGNPKQGKSMLFSHVTTPCMVTGIRANAEMAVRAGVKYIEFGSRPEHEYVDMDNYLKALRPEVSPYLENGKLSRKAERGKRHFVDYGCAVCHNGPYFTDGKLHPVGTGIGIETGRSFDTPTLIELWRTAPYLYDGRTDNMVDLILHHNSSGVRGETNQMTVKEAEELAEYILSL